MKKPPPKEFVLLAFIGLILLGSVQPLYAQRNQKGNKKTKESNLESDRRASEFYFIEGEKYYILEDFAKALGAFQKCLEITPENSAVFYMIAQILFKNDQFVQAENNILKAIELDSDNKYYYLKAVDIFSAQGNFEKATELYEQMIARIPETEVYYLELAGLYLYQNKLDEALDAYNRAEKSFGIVENISLQKQQIFLRQNKIDEAIAAGQDLVDTYPGEARYAISLADVLYANNRQTEAIDLLESYLGDYGNNSRIKIQLSELYRKTGKTEQAANLIKEAFKDPYLEPDVKVKVLINYIGNFPDPYYVEQALSLGDILVNVHPDEGASYLVNADMFTQLVTTTSREDEDELREKAMTFYRKSLRFDASKFSVWQNLLNIELQLGKWDSLTQHADEALELFPNNALFYLYSGIGYSQKKNYQSAIDYLEEGRKMASDPQLLGNFYSSLGDAYNATRDYQNSDRNYDQALALNPENDLVLNNYSYYLSLRKENLEKAREMSRRTIQRNPENSAYLDTYAWILYQLGEYEEAKGMLEKAISLQSTNAVYHDHYGDVLFKLGDVDGAVESWKNARRLNKDLENIDKKIAERKVYE